MYRPVGMMEPVGSIKTQAPRPWFDLEGALHYIEATSIAAVNTFSVRDKRFLFGLGGLRSWFSFSLSSAIAARARSFPNTQPTSEQDERDGRTELDGDEQQNKTRVTAELNWTATNNRTRRERR